MFRKAGKQYITVGTRITLNMQIQYKVASIMKQ
jgi:hypothetical protein